jgi:hypothetical protein
MFQINTRTFNRHPNFASVHEWYEMTKPWRGTNGEDRPFGGRKQRWCVLRKDGEDYTVSAWSQEVLRYRPDGYITITIPHDKGACTMIERVIPWVGIWTGGTTWLSVNPTVVRHYPHFQGVWGSHDYSDPISDSARHPVVVAVHDKQRTVTLRAYTPGDPLFALETLFENRERDLVSIPMIHANRAVRKAAYREYDLDTFAAWARAYLQMRATSSPMPRGQRNHRRRARQWMPMPILWLNMLRERERWPALVGEPEIDQQWVAGYASAIVSQLREKIVREHADQSVQLTHYQSMPFSAACLAYDQRLRTIRQLGHGYHLTTIPYADAQPYPTPTSEGAP